MIRPLFLLVLIGLAAPAAAADRVFSVSSFDRVRVEGPFDVRLTVGGSPLAKASGDQRVIEDLDVRLEGTTLIVSAGQNDWAEQGQAHGPAPVITLSTLNLRSATVLSGGKLTIDGAVKARQLDLQLTGSGVLGVSGIKADQLNATLLGTGTIALAGDAAKARLITSGPGSIAAASLATGDLNVRMDGTGETEASARFTAAATSTGLGRIVIHGNAACTVKALAGGPILCGKDAPPPQP